MRIKRRCKVCGNEFTAIKVTQFFCRRKCFKRDYYLRTKDIVQDQEAHPKYPIKKCDYCQVSSQLNFDPLNSPEKFNAWGCPHCGATNRLIWEYQENSNSFQIITNILVSLQLSSDSLREAPQQFQVYYLPIRRPGIGDSSVVVMTCDPLDISDMQKKNRKKLLFS